MGRTDAGRMPPGGTQGRRDPRSLATEAETDSVETMGHQLFRIKPRGHPRSGRGAHLVFTTEQLFMTLKPAVQAERGQWTQTGCGVKKARVSGTGGRPRPHQAEAGGEAEAEGGGRQSARGQGREKSRSCHGVRGVRDPGEGGAD